MNALVNGLLFNPLLWLLAGGAAVVYLARLRHLPPGQTGSRVWRALAIGVLGLFIAGLGLCGGAGAIGGLVMLGGADAQSGGYGMLFLVAGAVGLCLAGLVFWMLRRLTRPRPQDAPAAQQPPRPPEASAEPQASREPEEPQA